MDVAQQSLWVVVVEPKHGNVELYALKTARLGSEDELEGGKGIVGPGQGKKLLQIFKAGIVNPQSYGLRKLKKRSTQGSP